MGKKRRRARLAAQSNLIAGGFSTGKTLMMMQWLEEREKRHEKIQALHREMVGDNPKPYTPEELRGV